MTAGSTAALAPPRSGRQSAPEPAPPVQDWPGPDGVLPGGHRLLSLDAFRGLTIAAMILVNNPGDWGNIYPPLEHAAWNGWTPTDLIFPFFIFIMGAAIPYALGRRMEQGVLRRQLVTKIVVRAIVLFALGLVLNTFPGFDLSGIRIMGVLQRIALVYLATGLLYISTGARLQAVLAGVLLAGYWALLLFVPVPGHGAGVLARDGNLNQYIDLLVLRGHTWLPDWDPEGFVSTLPAIVSCLLGVMAGRWLRRDRRAGEKAAGLLVWGLVAVAAGLVWNHWFPINKNLWSSSFVVFTTGAALLVLGLCYWLIDVRARVAWAWPFFVFGANAILVYVVSGLVGRVLIHWEVPAPAGGTMALRTWLYQQTFAWWLSPVNASLAWAIAWTLLWLGLMAVAYRRRWFVRI